MSKLIEFLLGSLLITVFSVAFVFFFVLHSLLQAAGISDCVWYGSARAWIDSNGDGLINQDEPPLRDVAIHVDDSKNQLRWSAITGGDGTVDFNVRIPGCSDTLFEIYVDIPKGYRLTTNPNLEVGGDFWGSLIPVNTYYFGFTSDR